MKKKQNKTFSNIGLKKCNPSDGRERKGRLHAVPRIAEQRSSAPALPHVLRGILPRPRLRGPNDARNHRKTRDVDCRHSETITMIARRSLMFSKSVSRLRHRLTSQNPTSDRMSHTKNCTTRCVFSNSFWN